MHIHTLTLHMAIFRFSRGHVNMSSAILCQSARLYLANPLPICQTKCLSICVLSNCQTENDPLNVPLLWYTLLLRASHTTHIIECTNPVVYLDFVHTRLHRHMHSAHTCTHTHTHTHAHAHTHTRTNTQIQRTCTHKYIHYTLIIVTLEAHNIIFL